MFSVLHLYIYCMFIMTLSLTVLGGCLDHKTRNKKWMRIKETRQGHAPQVHLFLIAFVSIIYEQSMHISAFRFPVWWCPVNVCLLLVHVGVKKQVSPAISHSPLHWQRLFCRRRLEYVGHTCLGEKSLLDMFNYRLMLSFLILLLGVAQVQKCQIFK